MSMSQPPPRTGAAPCCLSLLTGVQWRLGRVPLLRRLRWSTLIASTRLQVGVGVSCHIARTPGKARLRGQGAGWTFCSTMVRPHN